MWRQLTSKCAKELYIKIPQKIKGIFLSLPFSFFLLVQDRENVHCLKEIQVHDTKDSFEGSKEWLQLEANQEGMTVSSIFSAQKGQAANATLSQ